jgi:hypothetical protein
LSDEKDFTYADTLKMVRGRQSSFGLWCLGGRIKGYMLHTYTLTSADNSVNFFLQHNVVVEELCNAEGTADAVVFWPRKWTLFKGKVFSSMINVPVDFGLNNNNRTNEGSCCSMSTVVIVSVQFVLFVYY